MVGILLGEENIAILNLEHVEKLQLEETVFDQYWFPD